MRYCLLGPLEVVNDAGESVSLRAAKERAFLATLLLGRNRAVPVTCIVESLWADDPPASYEHSLHVYASRLRKLVGPERLERRDAGYRLVVDPGECDVTEFERLAAAGRAALARGEPHRATAELSAALALWRGGALADLVDEPLGRAAAAPLSQLRIAAEEDLAEAELALGRHDSIIAKLERLVAEHPYRERLRGQLMLALYRSGRQEDALAEYRALSRALRGQLGLEPGRSLHELERAILNQDPSLDPAPLEPLRRPSLVAPVTSLVGRESELAQLAELLRAPDVRLITITGPGGIGKTRLALEAARRIGNEYDDGAFFIELAPVRDPGLVAQSVAAALGVQERPGTTPLETLATELSGRQALLVLDNYEHLLEAASLVTGLLNAAEGLNVLVTSRGRLHVYGEHEFTVPPLAVPSAEAETNAEILARFDAVELFVSRARAAAPGFTLERANARAVAEICTRLEGLPLAIELAAARTKAVSPGTLLERLTSRFGLLVDGPHDVPERHRSLRATIDWSYDLLDEEEKGLLRGLSVFAGGCTIEACRRVCGGSAATLESLTEKNLIRRDDGDPDRFEMLETIREYALDRLVDHGEFDELRRRHAAFFTALAERAEPELRGAAQVEWLTRLDTEEANLRVAFAWGLETGGEVPLRLGAALWRYWEARGSITEARERLDQALARFPDTSSHARARAFFASGRMALRQGDLEHARTVFSAGRTLFQAAHDSGGTALCTAGLGWIAHIAGPFDESVDRCRTAVELARTSGEKWIVADALNNLGVALRSVGELSGSRAALEESLALRRAIGELEGITAALNGLALIAVAEDDFDRAERFFDEAFAVSEARGDLFYIAAEDVVRAYLAFARDELDRAARLCLRALASCRRHGYLQFTAYALETLAGVAAAEGRLPVAAQLLGAALTISERFGRAYGPSRRVSSQCVAYDWEARAVKAVLVQARRELGEDAWEAAILDGRALELEEALAEAERLFTLPDQVVALADQRRRRARVATRSSSR
jgi:predicted ATPase/DNA-binding SARP family transcriptional activator